MHDAPNNQDEAALKSATEIDGTVVLHLNYTPSRAQRESLHKFAQNAFPGRRVAIAEKGTRIEVDPAQNSARLKSLELKVDTLLSIVGTLVDALADEADDAPMVDLDGNTTNAERVPGAPL